MAQPTITIAGYQVSFPYKPYGTQLGFMNQFLRAVDQQGNALLEAPTGSGKTACLLASALAWQRRHIEAAAGVRARNLARAVQRARSGAGFRRPAADAGAPGKSEPPGGAEGACAQGEGGGKGACGGEGGGGEGAGGTPESQGSESASEDARCEEVDDPVEDEEVPKVPKIYYATRTHSQIAQVGSRAACAFAGLWCRAAAPGPPCGEGGSRMRPCGERACRPQQGLGARR
jgi:hypothetical protein